MGSFWYGLQDLGLGLQHLHHDWSGNGLGEALGETKVTLRQLNSRCGPLTDSTLQLCRSLYSCTDSERRPSRNEPRGR